MFVGQTGIARVVQRTAEVVKEFPDADPAEHGAIPFEVIQRYINFWASSSVDLFGAEVSSNSANFFSSGLKGRAYEERYEEHLAQNQTYKLDRFVDGHLSSEEVPLRNAMNEVLRDEYIKDNEKGIDYWNRVLEKEGLDFRFKLPHRRFQRSVGEYAGQPFTPEGELIDQETFDRMRDEWLPTAADKAFVKSLMKPVTEPGKFAGWIAPPLRGINSQPIEFEYVKL